MDTPSSWDGTMLRASPSRDIAFVHPNLAPMCDGWCSDEASPTSQDTAQPRERHLAAEIYTALGRTIPDGVIGQETAYQSDDDEDLSVTLHITSTTGTIRDLGDYVDSSDEDNASAEDDRTDDGASGLVIVPSSYGYPSFDELPLDEQTRVTQLAEKYKDHPCALFGITYDLKREGYTLHGFTAFLRYGLPETARRSEAHILEDVELFKRIPLYLMRVLIDAPFMGNLMSWDDLRAIYRTRNRLYHDYYAFSDSDAE